MTNIFNDLNKLVNTVQKVDKMLTEKPKRIRKRIPIKPSFETILNNLINHMASQPKDMRKLMEREVVDALNNLHRLDYE